ncbi:MAG: HAMP domain-containing histidine kinase [Ruminococcaceae bacterium]|nr:HAMP domain-containing histidine kinase [Oscillospiraceae bacterium]
MPPLWPTSKTFVKSWGTTPGIPCISRPPGEGVITLTEPKRKKLSRQILATLGISLGAAVGGFHLLALGGYYLLDRVYREQLVSISEDTLIGMQGWMLNLCLLLSVVFFLVLFLVLLGDRLSYIRTITQGIDRLKEGQGDWAIPVQGNNELTTLAETINAMNAARNAVREKEKTLNEERETLIRTLAHDIRTPLTSVLSYSELLMARDGLDAPSREQVALIREKAGRIKELTDVLLDGGKRNPEEFPDAKLLFSQLAMEFEEVLEEDFSVETDLSGLPPFGGSFDPGELRRVFDNLITNVQKYADPENPVTLTIAGAEGGIRITQQNAIRVGETSTESFGMGLISIRRIAHNYAGGVETRTDGEQFTIAVTLSEF